MSFRTRFDELVNFQNEQENNDAGHSIAACYPMATKTRSVFVYFHPINPIGDRPLQITEIHRGSEMPTEQLCDPGEGL